MNISGLQLLGLAISILGIAALAIYSGTKPQTYDNVNGSPIIAGILMGTLVGGSSTVGTAQLAYTYGMSAWWFTLGGGIACLILGLVYAVPWRNSRCMTLTGIISKEFGSTAGLTASLLNAIGTFINILSQLIAGTAVIAVIFPNLPLVPSLIITALFMAVYVMFGGTQGAGLVGILKLALLYISMIGCGIVVLYLCGGISGFGELVATIDNPEGIKFSSLFARGVSKDLSACFSLVLGVMTTQTYAQAVMSGKSDKAAKKGALISAVMIPPIGIGGILVGLYMRANYPGIQAKTALTAFALEHLPGVLSGIVLGTLFIAVVGTGAGLAMGISTILRRGIFQRFTDKLVTPQANNVLSRVIIVVVLALAVYLSAGSLGDTILGFAFMSMGLRGAVVFIPMCCGLWLKGKVNRNWTIASIVAGPLAVLVFGSFIPLPGGIDSLFAGMAASLLCCVIGYFVGNDNETVKSKLTAEHIDKNYVIAIDCQPYAGGEKIAQYLAKKLQIPYMDHEILEEAAQISGLSEETMEIGNSDYPEDVAAAKDTLSLRDIAAAQMFACRRITQHGSCIIAEHFAAKALDNDPHCIKIFVHADFDFRADNLAREENIGPAAARKKLKSLDKNHRARCKAENSDWGASGKYSLYVNTTEEEFFVVTENILQHIAKKISS